MNPRKLFLRVSPALGAAVLFAASAKADNQIVVSGFISPETVVHDTITDVYLVSNVGGPPVLLNQGFISRVSPQGKVLELRWIQDGVNGVTLHGPKGLAFYGDELYVADVDTLRIFNRFTGAPIRNIPVTNPWVTGTPPPLGTQGALFLDHVVVTNDGTTYISDWINSAIYKVDPQGHSSLFASGQQLGGPNGMLLDVGELGWVTFLGHEVLGMTSSGKIVVEASLPTVDVTGLYLAPGFPVPAGALLMDGYARWHGSLFVTSWVTGKVYRIGSSGTEIQTVVQVGSLLAGNPDGPTKVNIDRFRSRLLLPLFNAGQLLIIQLPD
jgi:sugar lactone lactonase YvrE